MKTPRAIVLFAVLASTPCIGFAQQDGGPPGRTRVYDVRDIARVERDYVPATQVDASFVPPGDELRDDSRPAIELAELASLLRQATSVAYWEQEGVEMRLEDSGFMVVGCDEAVHASLRSVLVKLRRLLFEPMIVEVHELPGSVLEGRKSVLSAADADELLAQAGEHRVLAGRANPRKPLLLESKRVRNRIAGVQMQVAQDASGPDLLLSTDAFGASWTVRVQRTLDDTMLVAVSGSDRAFEPPLRAFEISTGGDGKVASLQLPVVRIATCHASAYLRAGEAMLVGTDAAAGTVLCVCLRRSGPPAGGELGEVTVYPVTALVRGAAPAAELRVPYRDVPLFPESDFEPPPAVFDEGRLQEWLHGEVEPSTWDGSPNTMNYLDGMLIVQAPTKTQQAIVERLRSLQGLDDRQYTLEVRFGEVAADAVRAFRDANAEQLAATLPQRCVTTVSASRETCMSATRHTPYVQDYDLRIASGSAVTSPTLGSIAQGFLLRGKVAPMDQGQVLLDLNLTLLAHDAERSVFTLQDPRLLQLDAIDVRENEVRGATVVALGQWTILQLAPVEGGTAHLAVVARLRTT